MWVEQTLRLDTLGKQGVLLQLLVTKLQVIVYLVSCMDGLVTAEGKAPARHPDDLGSN